MNSEVPYNASFTRVQFLFFEIRTVAKLMLESKDDKDIINEVCSNNLFQFPTEKSARQITRDCLKRLRPLDDMRLIEIIANGALDSARQTCLYAMMNQFRVIYEFMVYVIGEKYRVKDYAFSKKDINVFYNHLQEQNEVVASWSDSTIAKQKQVILKLLVDTEYLNNTKSKELNTVLIDYELKEILLDRKEYAVLSAFNCFEGDWL